MKIKNILPIILVIALCAGMMFGCTSQQTTTTSTSGTTAPGGETTTDEGEREVVDIHLAMIDIAQNFDLDNPDEILQHLMDKFQVTFTPYSIGWGDYGEKLGVAAATGDLPDVFFHGIRGTKTYYDWISQNIIQPWPLDSGPYPNTEDTVFSDEFENWWTDNKIYFLPRQSYMIPEWWAMDSALYVRKDWMDNLGFEDPTNNEEFIAMLRAFTHDDPNQTNVNDTYGVTPYGLGRMYALLYFQYMPNHYGQNWGAYVKDAQTGEFEIYMTQPQGFEALKFLRRIWSEGLMDPDFPTYTGLDGVNAFVTGRVGVFAYSAPPDHIRASFDAWTQVNPDKDFFETIKILYPWPGEDGKMYRNFQPAGTETLLSAEASDEVAQRYLEIHEWLLSDEGVLFSNLGLEGISYETVGDGRYESLLGTRDTGDPKRPMEVYPSLGTLNLMASWSGAHAQFFNPENPPEMVKMSEDYRDYMIANGEAPEIDFSVYALYSPAMASLGIDYWAEAMEFMMAPDSKSDEEAWEDLQQRLNSLGLNTALQEFNQLAREAGIID